ncbi:MAG: MarR family transcriptional regulator [Bacteroidales bacterium]
MTVDSTEILIKLRKIVRSINLESKKIQKYYGVSIPQLLSLEYLNKSPNYQATQKELRDYLNLNSSTVTGIINRLEKKGFIARLPKKDDRRTTHIIMTSKGAKLLKSTPRLLHEKLTKKLESLPEDHTNDINEALNLIIHYLDIDDIDASPVITVEDKL